MKSHHNPEPDISTWVATLVVVVDGCINCLCWSRLNLWRHNIVSVFSNVFLFDISVTTSHVPITNSKMTRHNLRINIDWTLIIFHFFLTPTLKLGRGTKLSILFLVRYGKNLRVKIVYSLRMDHIEILLHAPRGLHPIAWAQSPCKLRANAVKMETSLGPEH